MNEFVALTSTNIAKILNIYPRKGAVLVGADADIVVWDSLASKIISSKTQKSAIDYNVFEGFEIKGMPRMTLSRGDIVWDASADSQAQPGRGKFIERAAFSATSRALSTWKELVASRPVARDPKHMPIGV